MPKFEVFYPGTAKPKAPEKPVTAPSAPRRVRVFTSLGGKRVECVRRRSKNGGGGKNI